VRRAAPGAGRSWPKGRRNRWPRCPRAIPAGSLRRSSVSTDKRVPDRRSEASPDLWEEHAGWWQDGFTDGVDPEYEEQILPLAAECLAGAQRVVEVGHGEGPVARLASPPGAEVTGVHPTQAQLRVAAERAGGPRY